MIIKILVLVCYLILETNCKVQSFETAFQNDAFDQSDCFSVRTCGDCLRLTNCVWCKDEGSDKANCMKRNDAESQCSDNFLESSNPKLKFLKDEQLSANGGTKEIIQLKPQHIKLTNIYPGQIVNLTLSFKQAKDYPVDIYFLMDLSNSMEDDKEQLTSLSASIVSTMQNLTSNVTLGFGSFVDKNTQPYVSNVTMGAYAFQHHLSMANDSQKFRESVRSAAIINTYDDPESGFDALVQVIACTQPIAWRNPSRHIILLATDNYPHLAGDGKLGGAIKPNDGHCHLNEKNRYKLELERDYPSVGQISRLIQDNNKNLIVAVTEKYVKTYGMLFSQAKGVTVEKLEQSSLNILDLLKKQYQSISSSVELLDNANKDYVKIRYFTKCLQSDVDEIEANNCFGLSVGSQVDFTISIKIKDNPEEIGDRVQKIVIQPRGLNEKVVLDIEILRDCPCELVNEACPDLCVDFEPCVRCQQQNETALIEDCMTKFKCKNHTMVLELEPVTVQEITERMCKIVDKETDCETIFVVGFDSTGTRRKIRYEASPSCPSPFPILSVSLSLMGAIIAIGVALLLIWRLLLFLYDRAEYAKFLKDSENAKWNTDENPLYVGASTSFANPSFQL